jgi:hypothetical protein
MGLLRARQVVRLGFWRAQPSFVVRTGVVRMIRFLVLRVLSMKFRSAFVGRNVGICERAGKHQRFSAC